MHILLTHITTSIHIIDVCYWLVYTLHYGYMTASVSKIHRLQSILHSNVQTMKFSNTNLEQGVNIVLMVFVIGTLRSVKILDGVGRNRVSREKFAESPHEYVSDVLWPGRAGSLHVHRRLVTPPNVFILTILSQLRFRRSSSICLRHSTDKSK